MVKWLNIGWTPETISFYGIIFFIFFGSVALGIQGWKIWKNRKGDSVSATWTFIFFSMFLAFIIIGGEKGNDLMFWQGVFRIAFYLPVLFGLFRFKGFTRQETALARKLFLGIFIMVEYPFTGEFIYGIINMLGVYGVIDQGRLIKKEKNSGSVSSVLLFAYAINNTFWMWYMYQVNFFFLSALSALFLFAYLYAICMWIKFRCPVMTA